MGLVWQTKRSWKCQITCAAITAPGNFERNCNLTHLNQHLIPKRAGGHASHRGIKQKCAKTQIPAMQLSAFLFQTRSVSSLPLLLDCILTSFETKKQRKQIGRA